MSALSNWREEFNLSEVVTGKMTDKEALKKVSEKSGIKNKVTINPKLDEAVKEIGGEVIGMVEQDTTAQKQRIDMKQMILDRQKLKLRRKDLSQAKKEKKDDVEGDPTGASKQANVIAQESIDIKKENEKKRKNALLIQKVIGEGVLSMIGRPKKKEERKPQKAMDAGARVRRAMKRREHAKYVSGSTENVPDDIREEDKAFNFVLDKIKKEVGKSGYVSKNNPRKPQSAADKAKVRAHQAKVDKENAAARAKDPSQGRYPKG